MDTLGTGTNNSRAISKSPAGAAGKSPLNKKDYAIGLILLLAVVLLWTTSNFVTQNLFVNGYEKPFLVTYLNTSAFSFYLIPYCIRRFWKNNKEGEKGLSGAAEEYQPLAASEPIEDSEIHPGPSSTALLSTRAEALRDGEDLPPLNERQTAELAFAFCLLWFIANWSVNASLDYTTVASATILSSTSGFFTLGMGRIFRVEKLTMMKIAAVFTCFTGVLLVSLSDASQSKNPASQNPPITSPRPTSPEVLDHVSQPLIGDALALISAVFYALYVILLKVRIKNEERIDMQLFFGFVGLFNVLVCWPMGFVLHWTGVETFELPTQAAEWYAIVINMAITWSSDYLYVLAMLRTTPLVVTVGISLTIPVAVLGDFMLKVPVHTQVIVGAALVLVGFVAIGTDKSNTEEVTSGAERQLEERRLDDI
ncbi:hypothetical protein AN958_04924 [Leucoagaricus sp. SymC.cos]|nr:hypothetical protein AN958_04924 [Leucoagaricus sp. SymC.cos]